MIKVAVRVPGKKRGTRTPGDPAAGRRRRGPAGIKLDSVVSDITGMPAAAMTGALISGERRGKVLAGLAIGRMRTAGKLADLPVALAGRVAGHHALMCRPHLDRISMFDDAVKNLDATISPLAARYAAEAEPPGTIPGFGEVVTAGRPVAIGPAPHQHSGAAERLASRVTPGRLHQRPQEPQRPDRGRRQLHQAAAGPGRPGRDPRPRPPAGQIPQAGPRVRRPEEQGRAQEGDHRDRAHPAQDRLRHPQDQQAARGARPGLLHPPRVPPGQAGLPAAAAAATQPRLRHHHHTRGGRLIPPAS